MAARLILTVLNKRNSEPKCAAAMTNVACEIVYSLVPVVSAHTTLTDFIERSSRRVSHVVSVLETDDCRQQIPRPQQSTSERCHYHHE